METTAEVKSKRKKVVDVPGEPDAQTSAPLSLDDVPVRMAANDDIDPSEDNPRKDFDQGKLEELAADIAVVGVLQAIGVQPVGARLRLIWGERRWRASKLAGKTEIPARVLTVDDRTADVLRFSENKHESLSVLELAEGYQRLIDRHHFTVAQLAGQVKRSEASVRDTLVLNKLNPMARRAFNEKPPKLNPSTAMLIAKLPTAVQTSLLFEKREEPFTFRELKELIDRDYVLELAGARFEQHDRELVPAVGACTGCEWNDKGKCRNAPCYAGKQEAWLQRQRKAGRKVLTDAEAEQAFPFGDDRPSYEEGWVLADDVDGYAPDDDEETWRDKLGKDAQRHLVLARTPRGTLVEMFPTSVLPKRKRNDVESVDLGEDESEGDDADAKKAEREATRAAHEAAVLRETLEEVGRTCIERLGASNTEAKLIRVLTLSLIRRSAPGALSRLAKRMGLLDDETNIPIDALRRDVRDSPSGGSLRTLAAEILVAAAGEAELREAAGLLAVGVEGIEKKTRQRLKKGRGER